MLWHTYVYSHPKRSPKWMLSHQENSHNLLNTCKLNFQDEVQLRANCFFYILSFCFKCFLLQFLNRGIRMHIPTLTGVQNGRTSLWKNGHILLKKPFFLRLYFRDKGNLYANSCSMFWLFILNGIFFRSLVVAYVCIFPS